MTDFRALHVPGDPLLLPNAWDVASAAALAAAGFPAIGTTSLGVAAAHGLPDGRGAGRDETLALVRRLGRLPVLLTVDVEGGFGGGPDAVADLAAYLAAAGAVGINIEDGRAGGHLAPAAEQAALITAIKNRVPDLFVNARTDTHWLGSSRVAGSGGVAGSRGVVGQGGVAGSGGVVGRGRVAGSGRVEEAGQVEEVGLVEEAVRRALVYVEAGADGVFVPGLAGDDSIRTLTAALGVPVNVLLLPGMALPRLAALGVARVSTGSMLFRAALGAAVAVARSVARGEPGPGGLPGYAEIDALATGKQAGKQPGKQ
ncbi:isocitrate lyase/phosphoenolpyruvate mutase family protein [Actinoplanes sp. ATCC 53533]|nr:isocitrate lyase/phosphoenolpyruvate mutase family protein [Actinoplanes sp. ATCC 53533]